MPLLCGNGRRRGLWRHGRGQRLPWLRLTPRGDDHKVSRGLSQAVGRECKGVGSDSLHPRGSRPGSSNTRSRRGTQQQPSNSAPRLRTFAAASAVTGLSPSTTGPAIARGVLEGVAVSYARIADQLREVAGRSPRILVSGRVAQGLLSWLQVLADVLDAPVVPVTTKRATLRGTALLALEVLAPEVDRAPADTAKNLTPVADRADHYRSRREEYQRLYEAVVG